MVVDVLPHLPSPTEQAERLISLGIHSLAGVPAAALREAGAASAATGGLLALGPTLVTPSVLSPLLRRDGRRGFVVIDMGDLDSFAPVESATAPSTTAYVVTDLERGDEMTGWSPDEALPAILSGGRSPLTVLEGIYWLLQQPEVLARNHCFMTIGSRLVKPDGRLDARVPALWISNGTGRDGPERKNAPKVGWCWAGNRHSWLGFASTAGRVPIS